MIGDDNPSVTRAKMMALLALLDVLGGEGQMSAVAIDRVGAFTGGPYAGKVRLKFTVFGSESRMMKLADELTSLTSEEAMLRRLESEIQRDDKLRFAMRMIGAWTELANRLLADLGRPQPALPSPSGLRQVHDIEGSPVGYLRLKGDPGKGR